MSDLHLFEPDPLPDPEPVEQLSADRRRTIRQQEQLAAGIHPATGRRLRAEGGTCGDCAHHVVIDWHDKRWHKCEHHRLGLSHSASSDIRIGWPACDRFAVGEVPNG